MREEDVLAVVEEQDRPTASVKYPEHT
jgi:hypothetical protein